MGKLRGSALGVWAMVAVVTTVTAGAALWRPAEVRLTDLSVYLGAVSGLADGNSLYDFTRGAAPFTYPPFAALIFAPLTWVPVTLVQVAWSLATAATVVGLGRLVFAHWRGEQEAGNDKPDARPATPTGGPSGDGSARERGPKGDVGLGVLALVLSAPVASDFKYGQVSLFLAGLVAVDLLALRRTAWHGVLVGVAAAIKLTPLIFVPLLWFSGRRRAAVMAAGTFVGCGTAAAMVLPGDSWRFWTGEVFQVNRLGYITGVGNQSMNGALMRLGVEAPVRSAAVLVIGGIVAALALRRGVKAAQDGDWLTAMIVVGAGSVVLSPVSWTHHQVWLVLAALLPVGGRGVAWIVAVLATMLLPVTAIGGPLFGEARLLLAVAVAAVVPLTARTRVRPGAVPAGGRR
ncbi:glycosyltransferase 87 family protein [Actinoplanes sp. NPDC049596]|uniref:glycosyltransferase 87 family protein n=1 Tax=unclassified Actinoplanes TaxID=2626549 RepID=UPI00341779B1